MTPAAAAVTTQLEKFLPFLLITKTTMKLRMRMKMLTLLKTMEMATLVWTIWGMAILVPMILQVKLHVTTMEQLLKCTLHHWSYHQIGKPVYLPRSINQGDMWLWETTLIRMYGLHSNDITVLHNHCITFIHMLCKIELMLLNYQMTALPLSTYLQIEFFPVQLIWRNCSVNSRS